MNCATLQDVTTSMLELRNPIVFFTMIINSYQNKYHPTQ